MSDTEPKKKRRPIGPDGKPIKRRRKKGKVGRKRSKKPEGAVKSAIRPVTDSNVLPSLQHFVGNPTSIVLSDGLRETREHLVVPQALDDVGISYRYSYRGVEWEDWSPWARVRRLKTRIGEGKKHDPSKIEWAGSPDKIAQSSIIMIGKNCKLITTDGSRPGNEGSVSKGVWIGAVDRVGVGYAYHEFSSTFIGFVPHSAVVEIKYKDNPPKEG